MEQKTCDDKETDAAKARLLTAACENNPDIDPDLTAYTIEDLLDLVLNSPKVDEWNKLIEDFPEQRSRLYLFFPESCNQSWARSKDAPPSYRNLYEAMDHYEVNGEVTLVTMSVPLGIVPADYYPIRPIYNCPGIDRRFADKEGFDWDWARYRDVVNLVAKQLARFIHKQRVKRRHMIVVRKNSVFHDIVRTASNILGYRLEVYACPDPLWSEEGGDFIMNVVKQAAEDIEHLDL